MTRSTGTTPAPTTSPFSSSPVSSVPARPVEVVVETRTDHLVVHVRGEVDIATHERLAEHLGSVDLSRVSAVDLRLAELDFCDSHGVRQLLAFADDARRAGRAVTLTETRPQLARLIALLDTATAA
jgi:anti-anti-sigma factor